MDKQRWQQIQKIFKHLADKSPSHRGDYLDMVCEDAPELRDEVETLLASHDRLEQQQSDPLAPVLEAAQQLQQPRNIGEYRIIDELGRGGMGVVYHAEHPRFQQLALKLLPRYTVDSSEAQQRFEQEARVLSRLQHPALCRLFESFTTDNYAAIAMEFIQGHSLEQLLEDGPLPLPRAVKIILDLSEVLAVAHANGLVHRDIKSGNVMIDAQGQTRLIDFGIAKFADTRLTATGQVIGTPGYMSPEQWQGTPIDARTDLWSLGVLLFEMTSGSMPFSAAKPVELARQVLSEPPQRLSACTPHGPMPPALQGLLDRLLEKNPQQRLPSCEILSAELRNLLDSLAPASA